MANKTKPSSSKPKSPAPEIPLAEWIASGIGLLIVGSVIAYMIHAAVTKGDRPPDVQVEVVAVVQVRDGYLAKFRAMNHGDRSASDVHITGAHGAGAEREESECVLDFLPAQSEKGGGLFFSREPTSGLSIRALGYQEP